LSCPLKKKYCIAPIFGGGFILALLAELTKSSKKLITVIGDNGENSKKKKFLS